MASAASAAPVEIKSADTARRVNIPGTRVFLVPPPGFAASSTASSLEKPDESAIFLAMDLKGGNFASNTATFTREKFASRGLPPLEFRELTVDGYPAKLARIQGNPESTSCLLTFGDDTFSVLLTVTYPTRDTALGKQIAASLQTVRYDKSLPIDPFALCAYRVDESQSAFHFTKAISGMIMFYSLVGARGSDAAPTAAVVQLPRDPDTTLELDAKALLVAIKELTDISLTSSSHEKTNGLDSFKVEHTGTMKGKKVVVLQHLITVGEVEVSFLVVASDDVAKIRSELWKLSATVHTK